VNDPAYGNPLFSATLQDLAAAVRARSPLRIRVPVFNAAGSKQRRDRPHRGGFAIVSRFPLASRFAGPPGDYLHHGLASLAHGNTATSESGLVRWGAYYPAAVDRSHY